MSKNQISGVPDTFFHGCGEHLATLKLANNSLSTLEETIFSGLSSMKTLDLSGNRLTSTHISKRLFQDLQQLKELYLDHNDLSNFEESDEVFVPMAGTLAVLKLNHNNIKVISNRTFLSLNNLLELNLSHNQNSYF